MNDKLLEIAQTKGAMYDAFISEMEQTPWDETYLQQQRRSFGSRPIRVLTTKNHGVHHLTTTASADPKEVEEQRQIALAQARWLRLSSNAKQIFVKNSSEYIQFDQPETAIDAIREVYDQSKRPVNAHGN